MALVVYLIVGMIAGTLAGLFGIGGGLIVVPGVLFPLDLMGVDPSIRIHLAIGTSLATIIVTATSSTLAHHQRGGIDWAIALRLFAGIVVGTAAGGQVAPLIPARSLETLFAIFVVVVAARVAFGGSSPGEEDDATPTPRPALWMLLTAGAVIGFKSALFGIGGGTLSVPFLLWRGIPMKRAVGISAACGLPIAVTGATSYAIAGQGNPALPPWTIGFVYLPAVLGIATMSAIFARVGARVAHRLPQQRLKQAFAVLLVVMAAKIALG